MARYIDADRFIRWLDVGHLRSPSEICLSEINVLEMIKQQPTADVVEVKHGEWVQDQYINQECSSCGFELSDDASYEMYYDCYRKPKYCPECGAKMDITPPKGE